MTLTFFGLCFLLTLILWFTFLYICKPNRNRLLGITLPQEVQGLAEVTAVIASFRKSIRLFFLLSLAAALPMLLLPKGRPSFSMFYLWGWMLLVCVGSNRLYLHYNQKLYALKKQRGWLMGRQHIVTVDTSVSRIKHTIPLSRWWFLPSVAISVLCPLTAILVQPEFSTYGWSGLWLPLMGTGTCLAFHSIMISRPAQVYSEHTELNKACNALYLRSWSVCWVVCAFLQSIGGSLLFLFLFFLPDSGELLTLIPTVLCTGSMVALIMWTSDKIRRGQNLLLTSQDSPVYTDEDEYWISGFYNNPNDAHVLVEKRDGLGFTFNVATRWGKALTYGAFLALAVTLIFTSIFMLTLDNSSFPLTVQDGSARIDAPLYGVTFSLDEVQEVTALDTLPSRRRTNGAATSTYDLGYYQVSGYGGCLLFIHKDTPPYLLIRLPDRTILLNGETSEETLAYQQALLGGDVFSSGQGAISSQGPL